MKKRKRTIKRVALCVCAVLVLALFTSFGAARHSSRTKDAAASGADNADSAAISAGLNSADPAALEEKKTELAQNAASGEPIDRQNELQAAKRANADAVAWLVIPGADVDNAVMQSTDNAHYLQLDELGNYSEWGCYYADCRDNFTSRTDLVKNTVIYGHSQSDCDEVNGQRFTKLHRFTDAAFVQENPYIFLSVDGEDMVFEIAAVFFTDVEFDYINPDPAALGGTTFFDTVSAANWLETSSGALTADDTILTLSTCCRKYDVNNLGHHRLVVMARLLENGAPRAALTVTQTQNPVMPK